MNSAIDTISLSKIRDKFEELQQRVNPFCAVGCINSSGKEQIAAFHSDCLAADVEHYHQIGEANFSFDPIDKYSTRRQLTRFDDGALEYSTILWRSMEGQNHFVTTCRRALAALPEELSMGGPIFDRPCKAVLRIGAEVRWCRLVFRTLRNFGSYVRNFEGGNHPITYLTIGLSEASVRTIDMILHRAVEMTTSTPDNQPPLNKTAKKALDYIRQHGPVKALLIARHCGIKVSTLRKHHLPKLRGHGVENKIEGNPGYIVREPEGT